MDNPSFHSSKITKADIKDFMLCVKLFEMNKENMCDELTATKNKHTDLLRSPYIVYLLQPH